MRIKHAAQFRVTVEGLHTHTGDAMQAADAEIKSLLLNPADFVSIHLSFLLLPTVPFFNLTTRT